MSQFVQLQFRAGSEPPAMAGRVGPERPGSLRSEGDALYLFGFDLLTKRPGVWRMVGSESEQVSFLTEPFEVDVRFHGKDLTAIFSLVDDSTDR